MSEKLLNVNIHCISKVLSSLTHMMGTAGNESLINKEKILYNDKIKDVPVISGNAIRHKFIREPGTLFLIDKLDLAGKLNIDQVNYMFYGGALTKSSINENMKSIAELQILFPLFRLLGGSLRDQIVAGSMICKRGVLICEENKKNINNHLPNEWKLTNDCLKMSDDFIKQYQYTRGDALKRKDASELLHKNIESSKSNLMLYSGQTVIPGAMFYHGFILNKVSLLEVGSLFLALKTWSELGGTIGGQARIGHGLLNMRYFIECKEIEITDDKIDMYISNYEDHIIKNKEKCIQWLNENFSEDKEKK
jgi:hypothetical protein